MLEFAIKILIGDRAKYIGIILGLTFASFIMTQQAAIFVGLMTRTFGFITDTSQPNIWVMNPRVQYIDDVKPLSDTELFRVRSIEGVQWAVPLYKGLIKARLTDGNFQNCILVGIDDGTLIGGPPVLLAGHLRDLRLTDGIIVDTAGASDKLAFTDKASGAKIPLRVGNTIELNDNRAVVVGICKTSRTFQSQPLIYTTYLRALRFSPPERKSLSFILAHSANGLDPKEVCQRIRAITGLAAYTGPEFAKLTVSYFLKYTGIPINFGVAIVLGFVIGAAIAGQTFYNFTLDNLRYFGTFKAMGAQNKLLTQMVFLQGVIVGTIGWGLGIGATALFGFFSADSELSFRLPWQLVIGSYIAVMLICLFAACISLYRVRKLEPAIVFKS